MTADYVIAGSYCRIEMKTTMIITFNSKVHSRDEEEASRHAMVKESQNCVAHQLEYAREILFFFFHTNVTSF